jgi:hypothetical protein
MPGFCFPSCCAPGRDGWPPTYCSDAIGIPHPVRVSFRIARQPPTIMTWAELDFYDLPLIRPNGFVNSGRQGFSNQELGELLMDRRGYGNHRTLSRFCLSYRVDMLSRLKKRGVKTLEIELVRTKELAYEISGSR